MRRLRALLWGRAVETKLNALDRAIKANFDPNQPRVPAGNPDGGQWTSTGGSGGSAPTLSGGIRERQEDADPRPNNVVLASFTPGSDDKPPKVPKERPRSSRGRTRIYKDLAKWVARGVLREVIGKRMTAVMSILDEAGWLEPAIDSIRTFADPPKSLQDLQRSASPSEPGYDDHHIVERTAALRDGFPLDIVDGPENLVQIPRLKHWIITGWYMLPNERYGSRPPREYLRGKSWEERRRVGLDILIELGVLKP